MEKRYELTYPQKNIWLVENFYDNPVMNIIAGSLIIKKDFNFEIAEKTVNKFVELNDAPRFKIEVVEGNVVQTISPYVPFECKKVDISSMTEEEIKKIKREYMEKPIDILGGTLLTYMLLDKGNGEGEIFLKSHHIVSDAWSTSKMGSMLSDIYERFLAGEEYTESALSYIDFIASEQEYLTSEKYAKDTEFWKEYLKGLTESIGLKEDISNKSNAAKRYSLKLSKEFEEELNAFCKVYRLSVYTVFLSALAIYMHRINEKDDFVIGTPILNRANFKEKMMQGMFVSTMPVRFKIDEKTTFLDFCKANASESMQLFRHQRYPYSHMSEEYKKENDVTENMYKVMFSYQNARAEFAVEDKYEIDWIFTENIQDQMEIHVMDLNDCGIFELHFDYLTDLFEDIEVEYMAQRILAIVTDGIKNNKTIETIEIMPEEEKNKILYDFNDTKKDYPKDKTVIDLFEEQVQKTPNAVALVFEGKTMTYKELNERANQVAHYLNQEGVQQNENIIVCMNRSEELIITLLAINKCGCAYIPIDPTYPKDRISYMISNSNSKYIIKNSTIDYSDNIKIINYDQEIYNNQNKKDLKIKKQKTDLVYIIYTSGSTGKPKGVMINNQNFINFLIGINQNIKLNKKDVMVSITTISFDIFELEFWLTLCVGARLIIANEEEQINAQLLNKLCIENKVNIIQTTPTKLKNLTDNEHIKYINNMNKILLGGESLPLEYLLKLKNNTKAKIFNVYGPTETTVWSTINDMTNLEGEINVGKPIQNTTVLVLDSKTRILPILVKGQLYIGGDSVSIGYYKNANLTKEKFVKIKDTKGKFYSTGDVASIKFDGNIRIFGRLDFQVKINGQRIELEEIEKNIVEYKNIKDAIVLADETSRLICFYTKENDKNKIDEVALKKQLYLKLPPYMVPNQFKNIKNMPTTPNGKIDRKQLLNIKLTKKKIKLIMPKNEIQRKMLDSWKIFLKNEDLGINSNFFDVGGDSLLAIEIKIDLMRKGIKIDYKDVFKYPTIQDLYENMNKANINIDFDISKYDKDFSKILNLNKKTTIIKTKQKIKDILLTGVTGFLGAHILSEFIKKEKGKIYCIIREKDNKSTNQRLKETLNFFFGNTYNALIGKRIIGIKGDITKENLGISAENKKKMSNVNFVINSAAYVKHYGELQIFVDINIEGTRNIAKYCYENKKKMIQISTLSVSGNAFESANIKQKNIESDIIYDETSFYINQNVDNAYVYSKFKAEEIMFEYMENGLEANIIRFGNLTGRLSDSKFQINTEDNAFANRLKSIIKIGKIPKSLHEMDIEFTPIDSSAEFVIKSMKYFNKNHNIFHAFNHNHIKMRNLIKILKEFDIDIEVVEDQEFANYIESIIQDKNKNKMLKGIINDLNDNNILDYKSKVIIDSKITIKYMKNIGFEWEKIGEDYVKRYLKYLIDIKFL